jgi:small-conductance mechanosensitive channel
MPAMPDLRRRTSATLAKRRARRVAFTLLMLALGFRAIAPAVSLAQQPSAPAQPAEAPAQPKVEVVAIAEIGVETQQAKRSLRQIMDELKPDPVVVAVEESLPDLTTRVERQLDDSTKATVELLSITKLDELRLSWNSLREELNAVQRTLSERSAAVEARVEKIRNFGTKWSATRAAGSEADAPKQVLDQIAEVEAAVAAAAERARSRQGSIVTLQSAVARLQQTVDGDLQRLAAERQELMSQVFRAENPPIWSPDAYGMLGGKEIRRRVADAQQRDLETIRRFGRERARGIIFHLLFLVALIVAMLVVRRRVRRHADEEAFDTARTIFERPISMALLLTILISVWTLPQPRPLSQLVGMALLFPTVLILRDLLGRPVFPLLNALVVFWLVDRVRGLAAPLPHASRLLFMLEMIGLVVLMVWWMRPARLRDLTQDMARSAFFRVLGVSVRVVLVGASLALLAEASGYSDLGNLIGNGVLFAVYAGVILYGAVRVVDGLVAFALHVRPLRLMGMVQRQRWLIRRRMFKVVRIGAVVWWAAEVLERFEIADDVWNGVLATLAAGIHIGEASISIGDLVAFGATIWATFQISKFLRFVLEEDVYPRVQLRKGMPYAVSTLAHYTVLTLGFFVAILALGVDLNRFALLAGAFGVGIGFGLQSIVNNFVSGLILLTERPVEVGDTISLGDVFGEVRRIGIRSSTVSTWQGAEVIVPNGDLVSAQVVNWTLSDRRRRMEIPVGVAYGSNPQQVMTLLLETTKANPEVLEDPEPYVLFMGFGASSLDFEVRAWTGRFELFQRVRSALCVEFESALRAANIQIPFPQRDLHIRSVSTAQVSESAARSGPTEAASDVASAPRPERPSPGSAPDDAPEGGGGRV